MTGLADTEGRGYGPDSFEEADVVMLWDNNGRAVAGGISYERDEGTYDLDDLIGDDE